MRISDWSSDVCSSDLHRRARYQRSVQGPVRFLPARRYQESQQARARSLDLFGRDGRLRPEPAVIDEDAAEGPATGRGGGGQRRFGSERSVRARWRQRSEEHTSELQSLMRISYAVFCLQKKTL